MALNFQLEFLTSRKRFGGVKTIATLERAKKNLSICLLFFSERLPTIMCELNTAYFTQKKCAAPSCWPGSHGRRSIMHTYERSLRRVTLPRLVLAGKEWGNVSSTRSTPQRLHYTNTVSDRSGVSSGGGNFDI